MPGENAVFEIYNEDGQLTRKGIVKVDQLNIDIHDDDHRIVIYNEEDHSIIYHQGFIQKPVAKEKAIPLPIVIINRSSGSLELFCNSFKAGHNKIHYQLENNAQTAREAVLKSSNIKVNLQPGNYIFYTSNGSEVSEPVSIHVFEETKTGFLERVKNNILPFTEKHSRIFTYVDEFLLNNQELSVYDALIMAYQKAQEDNELLKPGYEIVLTAEQIMNHRNQLSNEINYGFTLFNRGAQDKLTVADSISKLVIYKEVNGRRLFESSIDTSVIKDHVIFLGANQRYVFELYSEDILVNVLYYFSPDQSLRAEFWSEESQNTDLREEITEKRHLLNNLQTELTDKEKIFLSIENHKKPFYATCDAPEATFYANNGELFIKDHELLRRLDKSLYVSIKDAEDFFNSKEGIRIKFSDSTVPIDMVRDCIFPDRRYFVWIEDESGNPLTNLKMLSTDEDSIASYNEKSRGIALYQYERRLLKRIHANMPAAYTETEEHIAQLSSVSDVTANNLYKYLIARLSDSRDTMYFNSLSTLILEDYFSSKLIGESFFPGAVQLDQDSKVLRFPDPYYEYIIQIDSFNIEEADVKTEYKNIKSGQGIVNLNDADYYIIHAIDKNKYARSGFIFLNTFKHNAVLANWKIRIEVK